MQLQSELGLKISRDVPLAVMITRLARQKGIDLFIHIAEELLNENIQIIVLGTGDPDYEEKIRALNRHDNFKAMISFDRGMAKRLYAAADMFLMPSMDEPCGLSQMIAMSYGAVPIARNVGGLSDTVIPYGKDGANGFLFDSYNAHELLYTVKLALAVYSDKEAWRSVVKCALKSKFTWDDSAAKYISIYNCLTKSEGENEG